MNIINQAKIDSISIIICWTGNMRHKLVFPLMAHKNRNCIGTPSTCCGRSNQISGSMLYQMNFLANLAVMQQEQSWRDPFWLFSVEQANRWFCSSGGIKQMNCSQQYKQQCRFKPLAKSLFLIDLLDEQATLSKLYIHQLATSTATSILTQPL